MHLIGFLIFGLIVGLIARALMPGQQKLSLIVTTLLGVAGSFLGGVLGNLLFGGSWSEPVAAGWIGSVIGGVIILAILSRMGMASARRA